MKKYNYFPIPAQVKFWDYDTYHRYLGGIAYRDKIICGCCGGIFDISEIYKFAQQDSLKEDPIVIIAGWKNIECEIRGRGTNDYRNLS